MTPRLTPELCVALLEEALNQEFGVKLPVEAAYHARANDLITKTLKDQPRRDEVMVCSFPEDDELWFIKKTVEVI